MRARTAGPSGASPSSWAIRWLPWATSRSCVETNAATRASRVAGGGHRRLELLEPARHVALAQRRDQVVARREVAVDRVARQPGALAERAERQRAVAGLEQDRLGRVEQRLALLRAVLGDGRGVDLRHPPQSYVRASQLSSYAAGAARELDGRGAQAAGRGGRLGEADPRARPSPRGVGPSGRARSGRSARTRRRRVGMAAERLRHHEQRVRVVVVEVLDRRTRRRARPGRARRRGSRRRRPSPCARSRRPSARARRAARST